MKRVDLMPVKASSRASAELAKNQNPKASRVAKLPVKHAVNPLIQAAQRMASRLGLRKPVMPAQTPLSVLEAETLLAENTPESAEQALILFQSSLESAPGCLVAWVRLAQCHNRLGHHADAVTALTQALNLNQFHGDVHLELGKAYHHLSQYAQAHTHFDRATRLMPTHIDARFGLALLEELQDDGSFKGLLKAAALYQSVLKLNKDYLPAYNNLGSLFLRLNELEKAQALFRRMIDMAPSFSRGYWGLAMVFDRKSESEKALRYYRKTLELSPNNPFGQAIINRINELEGLLGEIYGTARITSTGDMTRMPSVAQPALVRIK